MLKTELHCHTGNVSCCANATPGYLVGRYLAEGYTTVVLTNHLNRPTFNNPRVGDRSGEGWDAHMRYFLNGFRTVKEEAAGKLNLLLGLELRFDGNPDDFLVYGVTEDFLRTNGDLMNMNLRTFSALAHRNGLLVVQAHPFRDGMKIMKPDYLDGFEVYNGSKAHDSRDDIALSWAQKYGLLPTSGSDFHDPEHSVNGGIATDRPITSNEDLLTVLRSGNYRVVRGGIASVQTANQEIGKIYNSLQ